MEGKVFETHEERIGAEQFEDTMEKLIEYVSSKFNARGEGKTDILQMLRNFEEGPFCTQRHMLSAWIGQKARNLLYQASIPRKPAVQSAQSMRGPSP
eukprot:scaffold3056_cov110-Cylindrotheca_fusiformis.AAC.2